MDEQLYEPDLEVRSLFSRAWTVFRAHLGSTIAVFLIYSLLTGSPSFWDGDGWFFGFADLLQLAIAGPITAGTYMFALRLARGEAPDLGEIFRGFQVFGRAFGVFVLYTVMVVVGLVLLIIPGIYIAVAFMPAMYLVLDDDLGVIDTLQKAWAMTDGRRGRIFIVLMAIAGLNLLGLVAFLIGVIFTGALSLLVGASLYDELAHAHRNETEAF
jgi:uncharacterized membrane protein